MQDKRLLKLVGITYNQIESGVYAVILQEAEGSRRIPIIIGFPEAQAIECHLQEIHTPRPLTHDLMVSIFDIFSLNLREVHIRRLSNGVFAGDLIFEHDGQNYVVDARSSDAIALAIRTKAPIYTSSKVLDEVGFETDEAKRKAAHPAKAGRKTEIRKSQSLSDLSVEELQKKMQEAADKEDYELAAKIKAEIQNRENP